MSQSIKQAFWRARGMTVQGLTKALELNHQMEIARLRKRYDDLAQTKIPAGTKSSALQKTIDELFEIRRQLATNTPILQKGVRVRVARIMGIKPTKEFHEFYSSESKQALKGVKV